MQSPEHGLLALIALAVTLGFVSGLRPFATVFFVALAARFDLLPLPAGLSLLESTPALLTCGGLALAERIADTLTWHGHQEDVLLASLRVPVGAALTAALLLDLFGAWGWMGLPLGAALAALGQALQAALRALLGMLHSRRALSVVLLAVDVAVPVALAVAWSWPGLALTSLGLTLLIALPAAIWWARELRSRWRRWASVEAGHAP